VDGVGYKIASLSPLGLSFVSGTTHTYAFASNLSMGLKLYTWQNCSGNSTQISGSFAAVSNGSLTANYTSVIIPEYAPVVFLAVTSFATLTVAVMRRKRKTLGSGNQRKLLLPRHS
jgi:hypothetical protein